MEREMEDNRKNREMPRVPAENLRLLANDMGYQALARETGYSDSALMKMVNSNQARPIVEEWARLTLKEHSRLEGNGSGKVLVICKVDKSQAEHLSNYVVKMLSGKAMRFVDE